MRPYCDYCDDGFQARRGLGECVEIAADAEQDADKAPCGPRWGKTGGDKSEQCSACTDKYCASCHEEPGKCAACHPTFEKKDDKCVREEKYDACNENQYLNTDSECVDCNPGCETCYEIPDEVDNTQFNQVCIICEDNYLLVNGECVDTTCMEGTYFDGSYCAECPRNCEKCYGSSDGVVCLQCNDLYKFKDGKKGEDCQFGGVCPQGLFVVGEDDDDKYCEVLPNNCKTATYNAATD